MRGGASRSPDAGVGAQQSGLRPRRGRRLRRPERPSWPAATPHAAHYNIGIVHLAEGRFEAAAAAFQEAIDARPDFTAAKSRARTHGRRR